MTRKSISDMDIPNSFWKYSLSFVSDMGSQTEHYHYCYTVAVTLDNTYECSIDGQVYPNVSGFVVNKMVSHACFAPAANVLINFIEANSLLGKLLGERLAGKPWLNIDEILTPDQYKNILPVNYTEFDSRELVPYVEKFLNSVLSQMDSLKSTATDERLQVALNYIEKNLGKKLTLEIIADKINLSPERVRHLFAQKMGIPFSQYVLWQRIRGTLAVTILEGSTLTNACLRFGFTDQPHFNRTFKRIFGLTPNSIINYCKVIL